jgi:hypothetical protein
MNWQFFQETMKTMGFSTKWIQWTSILYENARKNVMVNGAIRKKEFIWKGLLSKVVPLPHISISYLQMF